MARQNQPSPDGPDATDGSPVRRAVSLGSASADPGPALAPAARSTSDPAAGEAGTGEAGTARPAPDTPESEAAPAGGTTDTTDTTDTTGEPATTAAASASRGRAEADNEAAGVRAAAGTGAGGAGGQAAAAGDGADEPPSGNPKKPLLAAAGIAGVVLLAVPLLIWATDDSRDKKDSVSVAAGSDTLLDGDSTEAPGGQYAPAEPTAEPSSEKPSSKPSPAEKPDPKPTSSAPADDAEPKKKLVAREHNKARILSGSTAADAVKRLAAVSPDRHICYRAYVKDHGWTAAVCDGATAGHEDTGRSITAINVAVSGTSVSVNEYIQAQGYTTNWAGAASEQDVTLGKASNSAPNIGGFAIGLGSGSVCQNNKLAEHGWPNGSCSVDKGWVFGGTTENPKWLEALRLTV